MNMIFKPLLLAASILLFNGCGEKGPVTVLFTSDTQGRLSPAG